jgi:hypothetical protein
MASSRDHVRCQLVRWSDRDVSQAVQTRRVTLAIADRRHSVSWLADQLIDNIEAFWSGDPKNLVTS